MFKILIKDRNDFSKFISKIIMNEKHYFGNCFDSHEEVEYVFGIKFKTIDNKLVVDSDIYEFEDDIKPDIILDELDELDERWEYEYTKLKFSEFVFIEEYKPISYPFIMVGELSQDFDRFGSTSIKMIEYVYLDDFKNGITVDKIKKEEKCFELFGYM